MNYIATPEQAAAVSAMTNLEAIEAGTHRREMLKREFVRNFLELTDIKVPLTGRTGWSTRIGRRLYQSNEETLDYDITVLPGADSEAPMGAQLSAHRRTISRRRFGGEAHVIHEETTAADVCVGAILRHEQDSDELLGERTGMRVTKQPPAVYFDINASGHLESIEPESGSWTEMEIFASTVLGADPAALRRHHGNGAEM